MEDSTFILRFLFFAPLHAACKNNKNKGEATVKKRGTDKRTRYTHFIEIIRVEINKTKGFVQRQRTIALLALLLLFNLFFGFRRRETVGLTARI